MKKDIEYTGLDYQQADKLAELALNLGANVKQISGSLVDNYFIDQSGLENYVSLYSGKGRKSSKRNYVIITENYLNEWSSDLTAIFTDNKEKYNSMLDEYRKEIEALNHDR